MTAQAPAAQPLPRWKWWLFTIVLTVGVLGALELASWLALARVAGFDGHHLMQYVFDPYKNVLPTPNYRDTRGIRHNSVGFRRSTEVSVEKPKGTYRIFLMGASTAYGLGGLWPQIEPRYRVLDNSQTIDAYLERDLEKMLPGHRFEVVNAAITSTWTHHELIYLNQTILGYRPDMILFLDGFNDFYFGDRDHDQFESYSYNLTSRIIMGDPTLYSLAYGVGWWLYRKSAFAHIVIGALRNLKLLVQPKGDRAPIDVKQYMAGLEQVFPRSALRTQERTAALLAFEGVTPVFMLQPMLILERGHKPMPEVERRLFDFNVSSYRPDYETFMHDAVEYVRVEEQAMADRHRATFVDLTKIYAGVSSQIYTDYCHLTPLGNAILADTVSQRIAPIIQAGLAGGH